MGNDNSRQGKYDDYLFDSSEDNSGGPNFLDFIFGKDVSNNKVERNPAVYKSNDTDGNFTMSETEEPNRADKLFKNINNQTNSEDYFVTPRGLSMPYLKNKLNNFDTKSINFDSMPPTSENYIELQICQTDFSDMLERYKVNKKSPNHHCGSNCKCMKNNPFSKPEPTYLLKQDGGAPSNQNNTTSDLNFSSGSANDTGTSDTFSSSESNSDDVPVKKPNDMKQKKKKDKDSEDLNTSITDTDESDSIDTDLEGLDDEDDKVANRVAKKMSSTTSKMDTSENGFVVKDLHDVTSSDLYRMQARVFVSDTLSRVSNFESENNYSELVEQAMKHLKKKKNNRKMFGSSEKEILNLSRIRPEESDDYSNRPIKKNSKYY